MNLLSTVPQRLGRIGAQRNMMPTLEINGRREPDAGRTLASCRVTGGVRTVPPVVAASKGAA